MRRFVLDEVCRAHLESVCWPDDPVRKRCGGVNLAIPVQDRAGRRSAAQTGWHAPARAKRRRPRPESALWWNGLASRGGSLPNAAKVAICNKKK